MLSPGVLVLSVLMKLNFEPLHNDFGARVRGMDLSGDLSGEVLGQ